MPYPKTHRPLLFTLPLRIHQSWSHGDGLLTSGKSRLYTFVVLSMAVDFKFCQQTIAYDCMLSRQMKVMKVWKNVLKDRRTHALRLLILRLQKQWNQSWIECLQCHDLRYSRRGHFSSVVYTKGTSFDGSRALIGFISPQHFAAFWNERNSTPASCCMATILWLRRIMAH